MWVEISCIDAIISSGVINPHILANAGLILIKRPLGVLWKIPSVAFSNIL